MSSHRISIDIEEDEHKYLKMCCAKLGITIKQFVTKATIDRVDEWEDKWMLERWERDGTKKELEEEKNNPDRPVYELRLEIENGFHSFNETRYSEIGKNSYGI